MAKVLKKKRTAGGTKTYTCIAQKCLVQEETGSREITPGQRYFEVTLYKAPAKRRHVKCGSFTPSQMSNSKMAQVDEAVSGADFGHCESVEDIKSVLETVAQTAREVGEEYGESADNMEQHFQNSPTGDACREAQEALDSWADDLENWEPSEEFDGVEVKGDEFSYYLESCRDEASELLGDQPSYEG